MKVFHASCSRSSLACLALFFLLFGFGCQGMPQLGQGGSMVQGSGGTDNSDSSGDETAQLTKCSKPLGTAALNEPEAHIMASLSQLGFQSPIPLIRLIMAQSNCFQVVDRGAALSNIQREQALKDMGMLRADSETARGKMVAVDYLVTPNVIFSNPNAGGGNFIASAGSRFFGTAGWLAGSFLGNMKIKEAQTSLFLVDAQSGLQVGVSEGSAKVKDFGGGIGAWGGGIPGFAGVSGYGNTAEGKLITAAFLDAFNKMVQQLQHQGTGSEPK